MRLDFAQAREPRDPVFVPLRQPAAHLRNVGIEEAGQVDSLLGGLADKAGCSGHSVPEHICPKAAGLGRRSCTPVERGREAALGVRQRYEDLIRLTARFGHTAERLLELVLAELDLERAHHRHRDHGRAGQHLLRIYERRKVDSRHPVAQPKRLLASLDRPRVVLAWPTPELHQTSLRG